MSGRQIEGSRRPHPRGRLSPNLCPSPHPEPPERPSRVEVSRICTIELPWWAVSTSISSSNSTGCLVLGKPSSEHPCSAIPAAKA